MVTIVLTPQEESFQDLTIGYGLLRCVPRETQKELWVGLGEGLCSQIWTALIPILSLRRLQMQATYGWSLSNFVALLCQQLFVYRDLMTWINEPFVPPPELPSLSNSLLPTPDLDSSQEFGFHIVHSTR
jgi:hypothetical protein